MGVMKKRYVVNLMTEEREALRQLTTRERVSGLKRQRAAILLLADEGSTDEEIANELGVGVATVERVRRRCVERGLVASLDRKVQENPSRARKFDGATEARLLQLACSAPPQGRVHWTATLLADRLVELEVFECISTRTIQRTLKKTKLSRGWLSDSASHR